MKQGKNIIFILLGLTLGIILKLFVLDILTVSGISMTPTLQDSNHIVIFKLTYGLVRPFGNDLIFQWGEPKSGDIVTYIYNNKTIVKRCIATSGEPLDFSTKSGYSLLVGEKSIPLNEEQYQRIKHSSFVPDKTILAVGDNYEASIDSRNYGFISTKNILGKVVWN